jgi:hypothetical protein
MRVLKKTGDRKLLGLDVKEHKAANKALNKIQLYQVAKIPRTGFADPASKLLYVGMSIQVGHVPQLSVF